jgi:hypothetical protein
MNLIKCMGLTMHYDVDFNADTGLSEQVHFQIFPFSSQWLFRLGIEARLDIHIFCLPETVSLFGLGFCSIRPIHTVEAANKSKSHTRKMKGSIA